MGESDVAYENRLTSRWLGRARLSGRSRASCLIRGRQKKEDLALEASSDPVVFWALRRAFEAAAAVGGVSGVSRKTLGAAAFLLFGDASPRKRLRLCLDALDDDGDGALSGDEAREAARLLDPRLSEQWAALPLPLQYGAMAAYSARVRHAHECAVRCDAFFEWLEFEE